MGTAYLHRVPSVDGLVLPSANSPQLLTRLVECVASGVRSTRGLEEALGVRPTTVRYYIQAGVWLNLLSDHGAPRLTDLGLAYAYAGSRRPDVYARAVWSNALAAELLLEADGRVPTLEQIAARVEEREDLADATLQRRLSAVRALIAPAVSRARPRAASMARAQQLGLPLGMAPTPWQAAVEAPAGDVVFSGAERDPDSYRFVLTALLEYGELPLVAIRALLDHAGGTNVPLGGLVTLAVERGDALRVEERLVVTAGAVERQMVAQSTLSVILSQPSFRAYLTAALHAVDGTREAVVERDRLAAESRAWSLRLFGRRVPGSEIPAALQEVLPDRPLDAFVCAGSVGTPLTPSATPFLDSLDQEGLGLCLPPVLGQLAGGLATANRWLRQRRMAGTSAIVPDIASPMVQLHGGMLHPGEGPVRAVPDLRSLRIRLVSHAPYVAMLVALLLLHRQGPRRLSVRLGREGWRLEVHGKEPLEPLAALDHAARAQGWIPLRLSSRGVETLLDGLESVGLVRVVGSLMVLDEEFFVSLYDEIEEGEVLESLGLLAGRIDLALDSLPESP